MDFKVEKLEHCTAIHVENSKLNAVMSPELKNIFTEAIQNNESKNLVLNIEKCAYCDSSGLSAILVGHRVAKNAGGTIVICGASDMVDNSIRLSKLDSILNLTPTFPEALDMVMMMEIEKGFE